MNKTNKEQGNLDFLKQENGNLNRDATRPNCSITDNKQDISIYTFI